VVELDLLLFLRFFLVVKLCSHLLDRKLELGLVLVVVDIWDFDGSLPRTAIQALLQRQQQSTAWQGHADWDSR